MDENVSEPVNFVARKRLKGLSCWWIIIVTSLRAPLFLNHPGAATVAGGGRSKWAPHESRTSGILERIGETEDLTQATKCFLKWTRLWLSDYHLNARNHKYQRSFPYHVLLLTKPSFKPSNQRRLPASFVGLVHAFKTYASQTTGDSK